MQKFSSDSSIINFVHSLPVIVPGKGEGLDFSVSNDVVGVDISNYLDILEQYVWPFLQAWATLLILLNTKRISGKKWIEPLASTMRILYQFGYHTQHHKSSLFKILGLYSL